MFGLMRHFVVRVNARSENSQLASIGAPWGRYRDSDLAKEPGRTGMEAFMGNRVYISKHYNFEGVEMILPEKLKQLVDDQNFAHFGVCTREGPHVTAVWIDREGDRLRINTAYGRKKLRAVERDPRVSISIVDQEDPETGATIFGRVVDIEEDFDRKHANLLAWKYNGTEFLGTPDQMRAIITIEVDRVVTHS